MRGVGRDLGAPGTTVFKSELSMARPLLPLTLKTGSGCENIRTTCLTAIPKDRHGSHFPDEVTEAKGSNIRGPPPDWCGGAGVPGRDGTPFPFRAVSLHPRRLLVLGPTPSFLRGIPRNVKPVMVVLGRAVFWGKTVSKTPDCPSVFVVTELQHPQTLGNKV